MDCGRRIGLYHTDFFSGLAVLLFLVILTEQLCADELHCVKNLSRANTIQIVTSIESCIIVAMLIKYFRMLAVL